MNALWRRVIGMVIGLGLAIALQHPWSGVYATHPASPGEVLVETRIGEIEARWQGQYQDYYNDDAAPASLTADEMKATLARLSDETGRKLALIYAFPHPTELELVLVIPGREPIRKTLADAALPHLEPVIDAINSQVPRPTATRRYLAPAQQLYTWLVAPLASTLQAEAIDTLVFCVGPKLRSLPLAVLHDGQQFLIERYNIGRIPAFNLTNLAHTKLYPARVLAMGASEFQTLPDLPAVPLELSSIPQNRWQSRQFLNRAFTRETLQAELASEQYAIVHLATHAAFQPGSPDRSYIQLWQGDRLQLNQLQDLDWRNLPVEILVLSACQTALGDRDAELGFAGLAYHAGVKSSLASLWRIDDVATLALMREFYWQLANPTVTTKAEALRQAQVALLTGAVYIRNGTLHTSGGDVRLPEGMDPLTYADFTRPYFWAAFTLVGSPW